MRYPVQIQAVLYLGRGFQGFPQSLQTSSFHIPSNSFIIILMCIIWHYITSTVW